jgi:hypothetical protein
VGHRSLPTIGRVLAARSVSESRRKHRLTVITSSWGRHRISRSRPGCTSSCLTIRSRPAADHARHHSAERDRVASVVSGEKCQRS